MAFRRLVPLCALAKFTGLGLGLAPVLGNGRSQRGALQVESSPGRGSSVRSFLPVSSVALVV